MDRYQPVTRKLTKDNVNAKVSGVCAGIAKYYKMPRLGVRIAAVIALFVFPVVTGIAYLMATLLLPSKNW